tara:strand:- start:2 stop:220 length:219 start_codon:yes stop_codon:yes gene_type:complete
MKKIIIEEQPQQKQKYPYLGKSKQGRVVLFVQRGSGTLLEDPNGLHSVGFYTTGWYEEDFEPIKGQVILEND